MLSLRNFLKSLGLVGTTPLITPPEPKVGRLVVRNAEGKAIATWKCISPLERSLIEGQPYYYSCQPIPTFSNPVEFKANQARIEQFRKKRIKERLACKSKPLPLV